MPNQVAIIKMEFVVQKHSHGKVKVIRRQIMSHFSKVMSAFAKTANNSTGIHIFTNLEFQTPQHAKNKKNAQRGQNAIFKPEFVKSATQ